MKISLIEKTVVCCLAGILGFFGFQADLNHHLPDWLNKCVLVLCIALVVVSVSYIPLWHYREKEQLADSPKILAFWQGLIVYVEALVFFKFGLLKLSDLHMTSSLILGDMPADSLSGYHLMDYFFGRAPSFKILIGGLQIIGAAVLLFRRTRLLGVFILMPIIVNIVCMDVLYHVGSVTIVATCLLAGLVYLLVQDREKLIRFFFHTESALPLFHFKNQIFKNLLRFSSFAIPFIVLVPFVKPVSNSSILGKYSVISLNMEGKDIAMDMNNDSLLTTVYFDQNETCMLRYNSYKNLKIGKALYEPQTGVLKVIWRYPVKEADTAVFHFSTRGSEKLFSGTLDGKKITANLVKAAFPEEVIK